MAAEQTHRALINQPVYEGREISTIAIDEDHAIGGFQFGRPGELSRIMIRSAYFAELGNLPDWRITCLFVYKEYPGIGDTIAALREVLNIISNIGCTVESCPEALEGTKTSPRFLYKGKISKFERIGFQPL